MGKVQLNVGNVKKLKSRNPVIEFDQLKLYFCEPYEIDIAGADGKITMIQPTIGDVVDLGEKRFYDTLMLFITNTTAFRLQLWEQHIDWNTISDFQLFIRLIQNMDKEIYQTFLPDIDLSNFGLFQKQIDENTKIDILYDIDNKIEINEQVYFYISQYLRNVFNIFPEEKITSDPIMKRWFIRKDENELRNKEYKKKMGEKDESNLLPLISSCCNHPGFKYKVSELKEIGIYQFYDSVKRLQVYESTTALQRGMYSGFMDTSKLKPEDYNFMKPI